MYFMDLWFNELVRLHNSDSRGEVKEAMCAEERQKRGLRLGLDLAEHLRRLKHFWSQIQFQIHCFQILMSFSSHLSLHTIYRITELEGSPSFSSKQFFFTSHTLTTPNELHEKAQNYSKKSNEHRRRQRNENSWRRTHKMFEERTNACMSKSIAQKRTFFCMLSLWAIITNNPSKFRCRRFLSNLRPPCCWNISISLVGHTILGD